MKKSIKLFCDSPSEDNLVDVNGLIQVRMNCPLLVVSGQHRCSHLLVVCLQSDENDLHQHLVPFSFSCDRIVLIACTTNSARVNTGKRMRQKRLAMSGYA